MLLMPRSLPLITENTTFGIGQLAQEFGITSRAIRFYEDRGLISPLRTGAGGRTRLYSQRDRARLERLLRGKRLGLSLGDIGDLLDMYETPADTVAQLNRFLAVLDERRQSMQLQLNDLTRMLSDIDHQCREARRVLQALQGGECRNMNPPAAAEPHQERGEWP